MAGDESEVLDADAMAVLAAVVERLIPTDEMGAGAREAGVTRYIESALSTEYSASLETYSHGLAALDVYARSTHGSPFVALDPEPQDAILAAAEAGGLEPQITAAFFGLVHQHTMEGMFGDPHWGGNVDRVGWKLLGYPGPKPVWSAAEQQIDATP